MPKAKEIDVDEVMEYLDEHLMVDATAVFGVSRDTILRKIKKKHPGYKTPPVTDDKLARHEELISHGVYYKSNPIANNDLDPNEVKKYYASHTRAETAKEFGLSESSMKNYLHSHGLQRGFGSRDETTASNRDKAMKEFGKNHDKVQESHKKAAETMKKRYGDSTYNATIMNRKNNEKKNTED